jgi:hypothetical protein
MSRNNINLALYAFGICSVVLLFDGYGIDGVVVGLAALFILYRIDIVSVLQYIFSKETR